MNAPGLVRVVLISFFSSFDFLRIWMMWVFWGMWYFLPSIDIGFPRNQPKATTVDVENMWEQMRSTVC